MNKKTILFTAVAAAATVATVANHASKKAEAATKTKVNESVKPAKKKAKAAIGKTADFARGAATSSLTSKVLNPELIEQAVKGIDIAEESSKKWVKKAAKNVKSKTDSK